VRGSSTNTAVTWSAASGTIDPSSGVYTAPAKLPAGGADTVTATSIADSTKKGTATVTLTSDPPDPPLSITTNGLYLAYVGQPYLAVLTGLNGAPPYAWKANSDALPPGLSLDSTSGEINGTPTEGGQFSATIKVTDSNGASASKTFKLSVFEQPLDQYGGLVNKRCPDGAQAHFYVQKIDSRWHLCTPAGNAFWMNGVYDIDATDTGTDYQGIALNSVINAKYATGFTTNSTLNWALQSVRRIQSWGFNTIAEDAVAWTLPVGVDSDWGTSDNAIPVKLPFITIAAPSWYAYTNLNNYASGPVKDIVYGIKSNVFQGYRSHFADIWDANFSQWFQGDLANDYWIHQAYAGPHNDYLIGMTVDDTDFLQGFGAGPDFPTTNNGLISPGYDQPHLGWMILVTAPTQTSNSNFGVTYSDTTVYSKLALSNWLSAQYNSSISRLNSAWGSNYTTFGSSGGFGVGTGILDEDGTCPSNASGSCWVPTDAYGLSGIATQMKQDLDGFLLQHAQQYFSTIKSALQTAAPGVLYLGPTVLGTYGAPPRQQILQAASQYVDVLTLGTIPPDCTNCTDTQQRIDFVAQYGGDKPWTNWEGYQAKADSYMSPYANQGQTDQFQTQAAHGQFYQQTTVPEMLNAQDSSTGTYHLVGFRWWAMYDSRGEQANWGLVTRRDDPYDGISATTSQGYDSWGYPTGCLPAFGCEQASYGDFIEQVEAGNLNALRAIAAGP
jgi:hypothetical protein